MKPEPKKSVRPTMSATLADGTIVEMLLRTAEGRTVFAVGRDDNWRLEESVQLDGLKLVPYSFRNNLLEHGVVLLPSEPQEYASDAALLGEIQAFIHRYVDV